MSRPGIRKKIKIVSEYILVSWLRYIAEKADIDDNTLQPELPKKHLDFKLKIVKIIDVTINKRII